MSTSNDNALSFDARRKHCGDPSEDLRSKEALMLKLKTPSNCDIQSKDDGAFDSADAALKPVFNVDPKLDRSNKTTSMRSIACSELTDMDGDESPIQHSGELNQARTSTSMPGDKKDDKPFEPVLEMRTLSEKNLLEHDLLLEEEDSDEEGFVELETPQKAESDVGARLTLSDIPSQTGTEPIPRFGGRMTPLHENSLSATPRRFDSNEFAFNRPMLRDVRSEDAYSMCSDMTWEEMSEDPLNEEDFRLPALAPLAHSEKSDVCSCASCEDVPLKHFLDLLNEVEKEEGEMAPVNTRKEAIRRLRTGKRIPVRPSTTRGFTAKRRNLCLPCLTPTNSGRKRRTPRATPLRLRKNNMSAPNPLRTKFTSPRKKALSPGGAVVATKIVKPVKMLWVTPPTDLKLSGNEDVTSPSGGSDDDENPPVPQKAKARATVEIVDFKNSAIPPSPKRKILASNNKSLTLDAFLARSAPYEEQYRAECQAQEDWNNANLSCPPGFRSPSGNQQQDVNEVTPEELELVKCLDNGEIPDESLLRRVSANCETRRCYNSSRKFSETLNAEILALIWHARNGTQPPLDLIKRVMDVLPHFNPLTDVTPMRRFLAQEDLDAEPAVKTPHPALLVEGVDKYAKMPHLKKDPESRKPEEKAEVWKGRDGWTYLHLGLYDKNVDANLPEDKEDPAWIKHNAQQKRRTDQLTAKYMKEKYQKHQRKIMRLERKYGRGNFTMPPEPKLTKNEEKQIRRAVSQKVTHRFKNRGICRVMFQKKGGDGPIFKAILAAHRSLKTINRLRAMGVDKVRWMSEEDEKLFAK